MKNKCISVRKFEQNCINEDAVLAKEKRIAISDGAGGGGLFAERWSQYLLAHLPDIPIENVEKFDIWIEQIWEPFYNECETDAKQLGGLLLDKFYNEGSFATIVAVWKTSENECQWMSFGDSVAFHYNYITHKLQHSFTSLADFNKPPYLINCKDEPLKDGFKSGVFNIGKQSVVFVASDALAHYILMMYEIAHYEEFAQELNIAESYCTKNSNYIRAAKNIHSIHFERDILGKLLNCVGHSTNFHRHLNALIRKGLIAHDDYSLAVLENT